LDEWYVVFLNICATSSVCYINIKLKPVTFYHIVTIYYFNAIQFHIKLNYEYNKNSHKMAINFKLNPGWNSFACKTLNMKYLRVKTQWFF
jgi:hypothetical protein